MKKIYSIIASAIIAVGFTACTQSDFVETAGPDVSATSIDNAIQFGTYMGKLGTTRADYDKGAIDNSATDQGLKNAKFGVFAYLTTNDQNYDPANIGSAPSNQAPGFMYNQQIAWNGTSSVWTYDPVKYWPNGLDAANTHVGNGQSTQTQIQKLSFFAYAPYKAVSFFDTANDGNAPTGITVGTDSKKNNAATNGIKAMTTNAFTGNVWVKYLLPKAQEDEAVDLLWGLRGSASYSETDNSANAGTIGTGYNINLTKQLVDEKVAFLFKHALTKIGGQTYATEDNTVAADGDKIGFKIIADVDINATTTAGDHDDQATYFGTGADFDKTKTLITLKSIKIQDGMTATSDVETSVTGITSNTGIYNSGWFNIEKGEWDTQEVIGEGSKISIVAKSADANQSSTTDTDYSINPEIREAASYSNYAGSGVKKLASGDAAWASGNPSGIYTTAVPVFAKETIPGITLIPGGATQDIYITVDYLVRTADPNLATGFSEVEQVISNKVSLASLQPNKFYTIIIHLGMTSVKFEAVVADWQTASAGTYDENGTYTSGGDANESHIWLPSNVVVTP